MDCNRLCSLCSANPAAQFCICSNLPLFCSSCRAVHESKPGFHFSLPVSGFDYITPGNQSEHRLWLVCLANSYEKLRENALLIEKCRADIEARFAWIYDELEQMKGKLGRVLDEMKGILQGKIEEAITETSENAYLGDYQPISYLADLIWTHSCRNSSEPIPAFTYQVQSDVGIIEKLMKFSIQTAVPELLHLNFISESPILQAEFMEKPDFRDSPQAKSPLLENVARNKAPKRNRGPNIPELAPAKKPKSEKSNIFSPTMDLNASKKDSKSLSKAKTATFPTKSVAYLKCQRCFEPYSPSDSTFQCSTGCHCKHCTIALIVSGNSFKCPQCDCHYDRDFLDSVKRKWGKCSCCGLNCPKSLMINPESHTCPPTSLDLLRNVISLWAPIVGKTTVSYHCSACALIAPAQGYNKVQCCQCEGVYRVSAEDYGRVREAPDLMGVRACCDFGKGEMAFGELRCGHLVCERHRGLLERCRVCHQLAELR